jgi:hypothetical protein
MLPNRDWGVRTDGLMTRKTRKIGRMLPIPNSQFPIPNSQFPIPNSQFSIPNSQFPIPNSQFPIPNSLSLIPYPLFPTQSTCVTIEHNRLSYGKCSIDPVMTEGEVADNGNAEVA